MAHSDDTRRALRSSYVHDGLATEAAAAAHAVPAATAKRWKQEERKAGCDWDVLRERAQAVKALAAGGIESGAMRILSMSLEQTMATLEAIKAGTNIDPLEQSKMLASLADSQFKIMAAMRRMMPEIDKAVLAQDLLKRLGAHALEETPQHLAALAEILAGFGGAEKLKLGPLVGMLQTAAATLPQAGAVAGAKVVGLSVDAVDAIRREILGIDC